MSDRRIHAEASLGARDTDEIARRCGAGGDCGGCTPLIEDILEIRTFSAAALDDRSLIAS